MRSCAHGQSTSTHLAGGNPLRGLLVVDLTRALAGPHATMILGDLGARVIKVERPRVGDETRQWGPPFASPGAVHADAPAESTYFLAANRNKESIALDFADAQDMHVLRELIRRADVVVENFRPGVMERLGLSASTLLEESPGLIVLSISGFGHDGPESGRPGYDQIVQGEGGLMSVTGRSSEEPMKVGVPIGDLLAGIYGALGVLAALHERALTGSGQIVRTSLLASVVGVHAFQGTRFTIAGEVARADGNQHPSIAPYGMFRCADGEVQLAVGSDQLWQRFCASFGLKAHAAPFATNPARVRNKTNLIATIERTFAELRTADVLSRLKEAGVPCGKVRTIAEVYEWEQTQSQRLLIEVDHDTLGRITLPGMPWRFFDGTERELTRAAHGSPPVLDADGPRIREWLAQ